ncbi:MAG: hypothetical protein AAFY76_12865 [Cyanobacteria bacterium J06649_11]
MRNEVERGVDGKIKDWKRKLADDRNSNPLLNLSKTKKPKVGVTTATATSVLFKKLVENGSEGVAFKDLEIEQPGTNLIIKF